MAEGAGMPSFLKLSQACQTHSSARMAGHNRWFLVGDGTSPGEPRGPWCPSDEVRLSVRLVEDCGDGSGDGGLLQPAFQPFRVLLGQNALADGVRHRKAASPQDGQHGARRLLGAPLGAPLGASLGEPLGESLGTSLCDVLLREIALV